MKLFNCFMVLIIFVSCGGDSLPKGVIPPKKMQAVFWDYLRADVYTTDFIATDSTRNAFAENMRLQNIVFATHKVSKEQFYKSYDYYLKHPALMTTVLDSMMAEQSRKQAVRSDTTPPQLPRKKKLLNDLNVIQ